MLTEPSQKTEDIPQGRILTEQEFLAMKEKLARTKFGMSLEEFTKAWKAGEFDDESDRHGDVVSLAMMLPEYWTD
jgi:hypothetical protein